MVKSWIMNSVTKSIYGSILRFNDASEVWKDLISWFHITNLPRSYQLTQQSDLSNKVLWIFLPIIRSSKTLWDDLDGVDCVKICQSCECCKATAKKIKHTKVIKFLAGLNDSYFNARGQIIMKKHVPDLSEVYNHNIAPLQNAREYFSAQGQIIMKKTHVS